MSNKHGTAALYRSKGDLLGYGMLFKKSYFPRSVYIDASSSL